MVQKIGRLVLLALVILGIFAWKEGLLKDYIPASLSGKSASSAAQSPLSPEDAALSDKLEPFIKCVNTVDSSLRKNFDEYKQAYARILAGQSPGLLFGFKIQVYEQNNDFSRECAENLEKAVKQSPADETLDKAGTVYAQTLRELIPVMNDADSYYKQENYRDDDMKKGKELDATLTAQFKKLFDASDVIHTSIDTHTLTLRNNELLAMEKENGRDFEWHRVNMAHQGRLALDAINALVEKDALTVESISPIEKNYETAFNEAEAYAAANPDTKTALGNKPVWFSLRRDFENVLSAVRTLRRNIAENKDVDVLNRDLGYLHQEYNRMIRSYNMQARLGR